MWSYSILLADKETAKRLKKYSTVTGVIFILLGLIGIAYPYFLSVTAVLFFAYLMLLTGLFAAWITYISNKSDMLGWLKSTILIVISLILIFKPDIGIATIDLLFALYFIFDAFANLSIGLSLKPLQGWGWWIFNAIISLTLGFVFLSGWPKDSAILVGLFIGISLLFDGIALLFASKYIKEI